MRLTVIMLLLTAVVGCSSAPAPATGEVREVDLPEPGMDCSLFEVLGRRESVRRFADLPLTRDQLSLLLWSAEGSATDAVTGATRTAPSAGATHPLELLVAAGEVEGVEPGLYRYDREQHRLALLAIGDLRPELAAACLNQGFIARAPAVLIITADQQRTTDRYGARGERYVLIEAGHAAQNIGLVAVALDLGTVVVGAFDDQNLAALLKTDASPLLVLPVGHPR